MSNQLKEAKTAEGFGLTLFHPIKLQHPLLEEKFIWYIGIRQKLTQQ